MLKRYYIILGIAFIVFFLDQVTKYWVNQMIPLYSTITIIPHFFDLVNIRNRGAAFGFLNRPDIEWQFWLFLIATVIAVCSILFFTYKAEASDKWVFISFGLILGGALGNLLDRLHLRAVIDFLDFYLGEWHWPAFNVADIAICLGGIGIIFFMWYKEKQAKQ